MAKIRTTCLAMALWATAGTGILHAQTDSGIEAGIVAGLGLGAAAARQFDANELQAGDIFPSVEIFDESGNPFNTATLRGKYTVLVNGCLT